MNYEINWAVKFGEKMVILDPLISTIEGRDGLINMFGRIDDAVHGRVLSPVQAADAMASIMDAQDAATKTGDDKDRTIFSTIPRPSVPAIRGVRGIIP